MELVSQCSTQAGVFSGEVFLTESRQAPNTITATATSAPFEYVHDIRSIAFVSEVSSVLVDSVMLCVVWSRWLVNMMYYG